MAASDLSHANFVVVDPILGVPTPMSQTLTTRLFPLGITVVAEDQNQGATATNSSGYMGAGEFVFCQGSNVASRGQFCQIISNSAVLLASANSGSFYPVGLAAGALSATSVYGWVQIAGLADYATHSNNDVAVNVPLFFQSIAGQLQTAGTSLGRRIAGVINPVSYGNAAKTASAPNMTVQLARPFIVGITASN